VQQLNSELQDIGLRGDEVHGILRQLWRGFSAQEKQIVIIRSATGANEQASEVYSLFYELYTRHDQFDTYCQIS